MSDVRRYLLLVGLIAGVVVASSPFWHTHPRASTVVVVLVALVIYEGVWWGHVDKPKRDEYHDDGLDARKRPPTG